MRAPEGTFDDDLFMVGEPTPPRFTFYLLFDIDDTQIAAQMIHQTRVPLDGVRIDSYVRFEARVGRKILPARARLNEANP